MVDVEQVGLLTWALTAIASLNWGAVEVLDTNLLSDTLGLAGQTLTATYIAVAAAGAIQVYLLLDRLDILDA